MQNAMSEAGASTNIHQYVGGKNTAKCETRAAQKNAE